MTTLGEHACPYLPGRMARNRAFLCDAMPPQLYHELMDAGFRRSGNFIYQPICSGCRACQPIRVPVATFAPSKSQRRTWRRNADLRVQAAPAPEPTQEKFDLYRRYVAARHGRAVDDALAQESFTTFTDFLYTSPVATLEITYREASAAQKLLGVGIVDACPGRSLSSVYFYFDPAEARRGLGTFSSLWEIEFARQHAMPYYYLGYFIGGCEAMSYKANFRPHELLYPDGVWRAAAMQEGPV